MALKLITPGRVALLNYILRGATRPSQWHYHLFKSNLTPACNDVSGDYTIIEADFDGYSVQSVITWNAPTDDGNVARSTASYLLWATSPTIMVGNDIYGYYVTPSDDDTLVLWAERAPTAPIDMSSAGQGIILFPQFGLQCACP